jgi:ecotin
MNRVLLFLAMFCGVSLYAMVSAEDIKMFPEPEDNFERFVIRLAPQENEDDLLVELMPGVMYEKDCNSVGMPGKIERKTVKGWGYSFYQVTTNGIMTSTMMACPPNTPKKAEFIYVRDPQNSKVRYNSKLPLVVYAPKTFELKYRVLAPLETKSAAKE